MDSDEDELVHMDENCILVQKNSVVTPYLT